MIRILKGFGMHITAYDPYPVKGLDVEYDTLENVFARSDVLTLHCPLTSETKHIVQAKDHRNDERWCISGQYLKR